MNKHLLTLLIICLGIFLPQVVLGDTVPTEGTWGKERYRSIIPNPPTVSIDGNLLSIHFIDALDDLTNALGLSSVKLLKVEPNTPQGPVLTVGGADLLDGTPIFDIKPYLPYVDAHPDARGGFTDTTKFYTLQVQAEPEVLEQIPADKRDALLGVLRSDPRPSYQHDPERLYGLSFGGVEVKFKVDGDVLTVVSTGKLKKNK